MVLLLAQVILKSMYKSREARLMLLEEVAVSSLQLRYTNEFSSMPS